MKVIAGAHTPVTNPEVLQWLREKTSVWSGDSAPDHNRDDQHSRHTSKPSAVREGFIPPSRNTRDVMGGVRAYIESSPAGEFPLREEFRPSSVLVLFPRSRQDSC